MRHITLRLAKREDWPAWQLNSRTLEPAPYISFVLPPLTVNQAAAPAVNTITLTPSWLGPE
jgi:hypothetical protein